MDKIVAIAGHVRALLDDEAFPGHIPGGPFGDHASAGSCPHYNQIKFVKFHNVSKRSRPNGRTIHKFRETSGSKRYTNSHNRAPVNLRLAFPDASRNGHIFAGSVCLIFRETNIPARILQVPCS